MRAIQSEKLPILLWLAYLEDGAEAQAKNLANFPFAFHHIAMMPDAHQGYGMPIGGVMATREVIVPNAVGVDIGCGMCALRTNLTDIDGETLKKIMGQIRQTVPVGFNKHEKAQDYRLMPVIGCESKVPIAAREWPNALRQLGTLGGGNHFIEVQKGDDGHVWIMIHSGSRNIGKTVADHYNKLAVSLNERWKTAVPKHWELAFLPLDTDEGQMYFAEMQFCVEFALANRRLMMVRIMDAFDNFCGTASLPSTDYVQCFEENGINIAHNYAAMEHHFGANVMVHRKGATRAYEGEIGIIPGSQGTVSHIVAGKGNATSFKSCSHGAGRRLSRAKARETLSLEAEIERLDAQGIIHGIRHQKDLDEASGAYKDIHEVMANQTDLVDVRVSLTPLAVIKG